MFALFESIKSSGIIALNPTSFVEVERLPAALCAIFVEQSILDYFKLELSDGADEFATVKLIDKQLSHTFIHKLLNAFVELFGLHGVGVFDVFKHLRRETWQAFEMQLFAGGQSVTDFKVAGVGNTYNVAGESFIDHRLFLCHKSRGSSKAHGFSGAYLLVVDVAFKLSGAYFDKRDAAAVVRVHICVYLEYESRKSRLFGLHFTLHCRNRAW